MSAEDGETPPAVAAEAASEEAVVAAEPTTDEGAAVAEAVAAAAVDEPAVKAEEDDAAAAAAAAIAAHAAAPSYNPEAAAAHHAAATAAAAAYGAGYPYYPPPPGAPGAPHHFWGAPGGPPHYPPGAGGAGVDGREGATSPSQIETSHRDEVQHMGCTCKKTRCLKLYCQCFGAKIYCGSNCRCLQCHNTPKNEKARKDAIRIIVARNPSAFDTKFKKAITGAVMPGSPEAAVASPEAKTLSHKVGCKCRRSNCMKKYCECYAANVNCSKNCRCVGCKNMGGAAAAAAAVAAAAAAASYYDGTELSAGGPPPPFPIPHLHPGQVMQSARDASAASAGKKKPPGEQPLQAAQNLAFLKHGASPDGKGEKGEGDDDAPAEEGVQALMLAAYAMTEFGQGSSPSKSKADLKREADEGEEPTGKRAKV